MVEIKSLQSILGELAKDVSNAYETQGLFAFTTYYEFITNIASPYVRNGFLDKAKASQRFISETAMLHMATTLFEEWCLQHETGCAKNFFNLHPAGNYFSWYKVSENLKSTIIEWVNANSDIQDAPQVISLLAENTLLGLQRRYLGEFYTPTKISEHLYSLTGFDARTIATKKVIDPACGSGNLLKILVSDIVQLVKSNGLDPSIALKSLNNNIFGYDIQPVAVLMTKLQLLLVSLPLLEQAGAASQNIYEILPFENIKLIDPLKNPKDQWDIFASFDLIIGNPPFLKVIKSKLPSPKEFNEIIAGQPNLYQMFLWWAIKSTRANGTITFLVPQSIRSGQYFSKLRKEISKCCDIKAITCFTAQEGVFDSVKQQMMIVSLVKQKEHQGRPTVTIRKGFNGNGLTDLREVQLPQSQVVFQNNGESIWCVSDSKIDYQILGKIYKQSILLKNLEHVDISNGGFVWNQNKPILRSHNGGKENVVPLISAGSIGIHEFTFPPKDERLESRIFVERINGLTEPSYSTRSILIKRTTPKKLRGRRIIACELTETFLAEYPVYFCENHVNLILSKNGPVNYLLGLTAWLNSRMANFLFGMMNGSSHLSKFELELLPVSKELLDLLENIEFTDKQDFVTNIDEVTSKFYGLTADQIKRISSIVPLPE